MHWQQDSVAPQGDVKRFDFYVGEIKIGGIRTRSGARKTSHGKGKVAQHRPTEAKALRNIHNAETHSGTPKRKGRKPKRKRGSKGKGAAQRRAARRRG